VAAPSIVTVHPADNSTGFVLTDTPYVIFDREIDPTTLQFLIEGPDTDRWTGPDLVRFDDLTTAVDDNILETPGYKGILKGKIRLEKVDASGNAVSGLDYTGNGSLWHTKAVFIPDEPFAANTEYRIYIVGAEEVGGTVTKGVASRTVFDTRKGSNLGDGTVSFHGGYTGSIEDIFHIKIVEAGKAEDNIQFQWWRDSSGVVYELNTRLGKQLLTDGVYVSFSGEYEVNDSFSVFVKPPEYMLNTYTWIFTTGAGTIVNVGSDTAPDYSVPVGGFSSTTSGLGSAATSFYVVSTEPASRETNLDPDTVEKIVIYFNKNIDQSTITDDTVRVWTEPVNGDPNIKAEGELVKILTIEDNKLTIQIS